MTFDETLPMVVSVISTALSDSDVGVVNVMITLSEPMDTGINPSPTITGPTTAPYAIAGSTWSCGNSQWTGTFNFEDDNEEATGAYNISGFFDTASNAMNADNSKIMSVDTLNPTLTPVTKTSIDADQALANSGDTVTISFTASEALIAFPAVTIDGNAADAVNDLGAGSFTRPPG